MSSLRPSRVVQRLMLQPQKLQVMLLRAASPLAHLRQQLKMQTRKVCKHRLNAMSSRTKRLMLQQQQPQEVQAKLLHAACLPAHLRQQQLEMLMQRRKVSWSPKLLTIRSAMSS